MKMKKIFKYDFHSDAPGISFWAILPNNEFILKLSNTLYRLNSNMEVEIILETDVDDSISLVSNNLFCNKFSEGILKFDGLEFIPLDQLQGYRINGQSETFYCCVNSRKQQRTKFYNSNNDAVIWEKDYAQGFTTLRNSNVLYSEVDGVLKLFSFDDGSIMWQYKDLPEICNVVRNNKDEEIFQLDRIQYIVGEYKGVLWLTTKNFYVIGLDVLTGKEVAIIRHADNYPEHWFKFDRLAFGINAAIDHEQGILFGMFHLFYCEIDLNNDKYPYSIFDISNSLELHQLRLDRLTAWEGDLVSFYEGGRNNRFGLFSRSEKKVIWSDEIPEVKNNFRALKKVGYRNGRYYVLDNNNILHVYAKD